MKTRLLLQNKAIETLLEKKNVILNWATGVGKSKTAIEIMKTLEEQENFKILLVVAEVAHKMNWQEEFNKWKYNNSHVIVECYASLKKYVNTNWDLIIFDEAHHLGSELRLEILSSMTTQYTLMLSATVKDELYKTVSNLLGKFYILTVSLKDAIDWGILPTPKIYLIPLTLDSSSSSEIIVEEWGKAPLRITLTCKYSERWKYLRNKVLYPNVSLQIQCTPLEKYNYLSEKFEYYRRVFLNTRQEHIKNKWLQIGSVRKRFMGDSKTNYVKHLLHLLDNKRIICFCASISQSEELGSNHIHSKRKDSLKTIKDFNNKFINSIFAVGMLQEGQNLVDVEAGIIVQLDGEERAFIQKFGRNLRSEDPIQFIFYYKNTKDEEYLKNVLDSIDNEYIYTIENVLNKITYDDLFE